MAPGTQRRGSVGPGGSRGPWGRDAAKAAKGTDVPQLLHSRLSIPRQPLPHSPVAQRSPVGSRKARASLIRNVSRQGIDGEWIRGATPRPTEERDV